MKPVVLMVHGIFDKGAIFLKLARHIEKLGMDTVCPDFSPNNGSVPLEMLALQVQQHVSEIKKQGRPIYLVGFSMGGLISRVYMQHWGGVKEVNRWVTIASPHRGTLTASLFWGKGVAQMRMGSAFLQQLNDELHLIESIPTLSIWTPYDLMVLPSESARLSIGKDIEVACPMHSMMLTNETVFRHIGHFLQKDCPSIGV